MSEENFTWTTVDNSSLVSAFKYNSETKELDVEFKSNGAKYRYFDVPTFIGESIASDEKPGSFIQRNVIKAGKKYKKL